MIKRVFIVAAQTNLNFEKFNSKETLFIGVERGALDLISKQIALNWAIGDFDKVSKEELSLIQQNAQHFLPYPKEKDYLDGELAIKKALELQAERIYFVANPTKRYDKNLSIFDLVFKYGIIFFNDNTTMFLLKKGRNKISFADYQEKNYISFFAKEPTKITIQNMKYNVQDLELDTYDTRCISNVFLPYVDPEIETNNEVVCVLSD